MMTLDPLILSRLQFFWVVSFHILLPAFTVGLACYIAALELMHLKTRDRIYLRISVFWTRIFAISFGLGVVTGIVMPFQFGTNWSRFSDITSNVIGPLMAYEGLTAFFLEASFLGILLFGRKLVPPWAHGFAAVMVALGTLFSSFWILAANSWMQTPAGHEIVDGRFHSLDWMAVIFNPSFPYRLSHTVTGFLVTTGFVVVAVAAYHLRHARAVEECRRMLSMTLWLLTVLVPLQILLGDMHGLNTLEHQPAKIAALEGHWDTGPCAIHCRGMARPAGRGHALGARSSLPRKPRPHAFARWNGAGTEGMAARRSPAGGDHFLVLSHHGWHRAADAARGGGCSLVAMERTPL